MSKHISISAQEAADRLAIRELVEAYAHCADRRDAEGQMALFTADTHFVVYMDAKDPTPSQELHSRAALAPVPSTAMPPWPLPPAKFSALIDLVWAVDRRDKLPSDIPSPLNVISIR